MKLDPEKAAARSEPERLRGPGELPGATERDHDFQARTPAEDRHPRCPSATDLSASQRKPQDATRPQIGEIVEVRPIEEILATLDSEGALEGVPFIPEMLAFCGKRFPVFKRADYTCTNGEPRYLENTLHLDNLRCDGSALENVVCKGQRTFCSRTDITTGARSGLNAPLPTIGTRTLRTPYSVVHAYCSNVSLSNTRVPERIL